MASEPKSPPLPSPSAHLPLYRRPLMKIWEEGDNRRREEEVNPRIGKKGLRSETSLTSDVRQCWGFSIQLHLWRVLATTRRSPIVASSSISIPNPINEWQLAPRRIGKLQDSHSFYHLRSSPVCLSWDRTTMPYDGDEAEKKVADLPRLHPESLRFQDEHQFLALWSSPSLGPWPWRWPWRGIVYCCYRWSKLRKRCLDEELWEHARREHPLARSSEIDPIHQRSCSDMDRRRYRGHLVLLAESCGAHRWREGCQKMQESGMWTEDVDKAIGALNQDQGRANENMMHI